MRDTCDKIVVVPRFDAARDEARQWQHRINHAVTIDTHAMTSIWIYSSMLYLVYMCDCYM